MANHWKIPKPALKLIKKLTTACIILNKMVI